MNSFAFGNNLVKINDLQIPQEFFNQYEPQNTLSKYDNIFYNMANLPNSIQIKSNQQGISLELQGEIDKYIQNYDIYKQKEENRLNPIPTFDQLKQKTLEVLGGIYNNNATWLFTIQDGTSSLTKNQDWLLTKLSTKPIFFDNKNQPQQKDFTVDQVFSLKDQINNLGFSILNLQLQLQTAVNATKTQKALNQYTEEYLQSEFDKINKTIIVD